MQASNESNHEQNHLSIEAKPDQPGVDLQTVRTHSSSEEPNHQNHIIVVDQNRNPQSNLDAPDQPRDVPNDVRNALLTVAVLLAAATYQAAFNPPGGLWQEDGQTTVHRPGPVASTATEIKQVAGVSILGTKHKDLFIMFIFGNTVGFLFSMGTIEDLTSGFTRKLELTLAIAAISFTYGLSVCIISPSEYRPLTAYTFVAAFALALIVRVRRVICARRTAAATCSSTR